DELERQVQRERGEPLKALEDPARDGHLPYKFDGKAEHEDRDGGADVSVTGDRTGEERGQENEDEAWYGYQPHRARQEGPDARVAAGAEHRGVARQDDDDDQRRSGSDCVHRDQEGDLAVDLRTQHATGDGVVDKPADSRHEAAEKEDQIRAEKPVSLDLGQQLAEIQSLHVGGL